MTSMNDDELRDLFQRSRMAERAETPSFGRVLAARRRSSSRLSRRLVAFAAVATVAIAAVVVYRQRPAGEGAEVIPAGLGSLRVPSDFLLDVLGAETLRTVPEIGRADDWFPSLSAMKGARP